MKSEQDQGARRRGAPPWLGWAGLLAAVALLVWNAWSLGVHNDEQIQLSALLGQPLLEHATPPFDLYDFSHVGEGDDPRADLERGNALVFRGAVKWCQAPFPYHLRFFRPLSSAALALELRMFGFHFRPYHLVQLGLLLATCALLTRLCNRALVGSGQPPLSVPLATGLLALNPVSQELLTLFCTVHYLLAALPVLVAYLLIAREDFGPTTRALGALALGALGLLAGETSLLMQAVGTCVLAAQARRLSRAQRLAWLLMMVEVAGYLLWYRGHRHGAEGRGYLGHTGASFAALVERPVDAALDLFGGAFLGDFRDWKGFLGPVGRRLGWGAVGASLAVGSAVVAYVVRFPRARTATGWLLGATALAALPVAVVAQDKLRVLALPSLPFQFLLCMMLRDSWRALRGEGEPPRLDEAAPTPGRRGPRRALAVLVVGYASARLATQVVLTPLAMRESGIPSQIAASRWLGGLRIGTRDVHPIHLDAATSTTTTSFPNILFASGTTGVPYPFGPALLEQNGFDPDVDSWLFVTDLPPGGTRVYHAGEGRFRVSLSEQGVDYHLKHRELYPLMQRCFAASSSEFHTRYADFFVFTSTSNGEPVDFELTVTPGLQPRFWARGTDGKIAPVEPPPIGRGAIY
jgi:hypothetical protein